MLVDFLIKITGKIKKIGTFFKELWGDLLDLFRFGVLIGLYVIAQIVFKVVRMRIMPRSLSSFIAKRFSVFYSRTTAIFERNEPFTISRIDLIEVALRNMSAKKARTFITVGGMSLGIAAIVFLVSVGYGLQNLVISRVARLDELKQADIDKNPGSKVSMDDKTVADIKQVPGVKEVLPLISVVGRVEFNNSITDVAVYGVTSDYLKNSAIKPIVGSIFESNELAVVLDSEKGKVAGLKTERLIPEMGKEISKVDYTINPGEWIRVREGPSTNAKILGYTRRVEGIQQGVQVWGSEYESSGDEGNAGKDLDGNYYGRWIKTDVYLWQQGDCEKDDSDCEGGKYKIMRNGEGRQIQEVGYFAEFNASIHSTIKEFKSGQVLGDSTSTLTEELVLAETTTVDSTQTSSSGMTIKVTDDPNFIEILEENISVDTQKVTRVDLSNSAKKLAVVNKAFLQILGIREQEAVDKEFNISFIVTSDLLKNSTEKVESNLSSYKIVGVTPDDKVPMMYVPFIDLRSLGVGNYSQIRMIAKDQTVLPKTRLQIESMGFVTRSVADTVNQINSFFNTVRLVLGAMGVVALVVASLGMFNTLTVSLLERTREVGLMRAMGMKSSEVQELFLSESIIMGVFGGCIGLVLGFVAGKFLGFILSIFSVAKGVGYIDITKIPGTFVLLIIILSVTVGFITGIYPATRAKKISALNALRYE